MHTCTQHKISSSSPQPLQRLFSFSHLRLFKLDTLSPFLFIQYLLTVQYSNETAFTGDIKSNFSILILLDLSKACHCCLFPSPVNSLPSLSLCDSTVSWCWSSFSFHLLLWWLSPPFKCWCFSGLILELSQHSLHPLWSNTHLPRVLLVIADYFPKSHPK